MIDEVLEAANMPLPTPFAVVLARATHRWRSWSRSSSRLAAAATAQ